MFEHGVDRRGERTDGRVLSLWGSDRPSTDVECEFESHPAHDRLRPMTWHRRRRRYSRHARSGGASVVGSPSPSTGTNRVTLTRVVSASAGTKSMLSGLCFNRPVVTTSSETGSGERADRTAGGSSSGRMAE